MEDPNPSIGHPGAPLRAWLFEGPKSTGSISGTFQFQVPAPRVSSARFGAGLFGPKVSHSSKLHSSWTEPRLRTAHIELFQPIRFPKSWIALICFGPTRLVPRKGFLPSEMGHCESTDVEEHLGQPLALRRACFEGNQLAGIQGEPGIREDSP